MGQYIILTCEMCETKKESPILKTRIFRIPQIGETNFRHIEESEKREFSVLRSKRVEDFQERFSVF